MCAVVGVAGAAAWRVLGLAWHPVAEVGSWSDVVALAQQQRDVVRGEFRKTLFDEEARGEKMGQSAA